MEAIITCDLCFSNIPFVEFETHYEGCVGHNNAFEIIMRNSSSKSTKRSLKWQDNRLLVKEKKIKISSSLDDWKIKCCDCNEIYNSKMEMRHITSEKHRVAVLKDIEHNAHILPISMESHFPVKSYRIYPKESKLDLHELIDQCHDDILKILLYCLSEYRSIKFTIKVYGLYDDKSEVGKKLELVKHFATPYKAAYETHSLVEQFSDALNYLVSSTIEFQHSKDYQDLSIKSFNCFEITAIKLEHTPAAGFIPAPPKIKSRNAIINVRNNDHFCFKWSILAYLGFLQFQNTTFEKDSTKKHKRECLTFPSHYKVLDISQDVIYYDGVKLDFSDIEFPISIEGIRNSKEITRNSALMFMKLMMMERTSLDQQLERRKLDPVI